MAAGGHGGGPDRRAEAQLARLAPGAVAVLRPRPAYSHEHCLLGLELDGARRPCPLRRRTYLPRAPLESQAGARRSRPLEHRSDRRARHARGRRDTGPAGVSRVDLAGSGRVRRWPPAQRAERLHDGRDAQHPRGLCLELVHPGRVLLSHDPLHHGLCPPLPTRPRERRDPGLLHAYRCRHVVRHAVARRCVLRGPAAPGSANLLLCARRARLLDEHPLLYADRGASFHLQPRPVVAADDRDPLQRGDDGPGLGGWLQSAPDLPRYGRGGPTELRRAFPPGGDRGLRPRIHAGNHRGVSHHQCLLALHELHRWPLAPLHVRLRCIRDLGRCVWTPAAAHRRGAQPDRGRHPFLARARRLRDLRGVDLDRRRAPGLLLAGGRGLHPIGGGGRADVALADRGWRADGREPPRVRGQPVGHVAAARARRNATRRRGVGMNLHTSHRAIVGLAFSGSLALTVLIAILPAASVQKTAGIPGAPTRSSLAEQGRSIYLREGCGYCHTQFVRDLPLDRPYGRATFAEDYANEDPPLPGTERTGPDLSNVAARQPSDTWHLLHLYNPRTVVPQSVMPGFPWYFEEKSAAAEGDVVVPVPSRFVAAQGVVIVARPEARALVAYLLSLRQPEPP